MTKSELLETAEQAAQECADRLRDEGKVPAAAKLAAVVSRETKRAIDALLSDATVTAKDRTALERRFATVLTRELRAKAGVAKLASPAGAAVSLRVVASGRTAPLFVELVEASNARYALLAKLAKAGQRPRLTRETRAGWVAFVIDSNGVGQLAWCDEKKARAIKSVKLVEPALAVSPDGARCFMQSAGAVTALELPKGTAKKLALPRDLVLAGAVSPTELIGVRDDAFEWWSVASTPKCLARLEGADGHSVANVGGAVVLHGMKGLALIARREGAIVKLAALPLKETLSVTVSETSRLLIKTPEAVVEVSGLTPDAIGAPITDCAGAFRK